MVNKGLRSDQIKASTGPGRRIGRADNLNLGKKACPTHAVIMKSGGISIAGGSTMTYMTNLTRIENAFNIRSSHMWVFVSKFSFSFFWSIYGQSTWFRRFQGNHCFACQMEKNLREFWRYYKIQFWLNLLGMQSTLYIFGKELNFMYNPKSLHMYEYIYMYTYI